MDAVEQIAVESWSVIQRSCKNPLLTLCELAQKMVVGTNGSAYEKMFSPVIAALSPR